MAWIPFFAACVINGLGHWWGDHNFETPDHSRNLPGNGWAIVTCGESLHNNHHYVQHAATFSARSGEIDLGYVYFRCLRAVGLASLR
jgi:stearoyl-CoA desaturase (delta-9 desaturase)